MTYYTNNHNKCTWTKLFSKKRLSDYKLQFVKVMVKKCESKKMHKGILDKY